MPTSLTAEFTATTLSALFTGCLWIPIIANRLREMGVWKALSNPEPDVRPVAQWAYRAAHAHQNAVENLVVFAPLAVMVVLAGRTDATTALACWVYLGSRVLHALVYTFGIPVLRTFSFLAGFAAQGALALRLLGVL